ncbi:hypothetical protein CENSYa_0936 [Cenarchaeum symbiosum A]|uniref:Methylenetetrahydrofolate reductase (NAD(P)H) n=1 Tax=Cenarchaeum symbiosum (strain A) TaxID=414004 RepID=A0RW51_CENSY|nr:hypothetical protein CENSYa_0936 [Cenarchaeum symbiosum A]
MAIIYEINPPKVEPGAPLPPEEAERLLAPLLERVSRAAAVCDGIHLTESVLGTSRISPITAAALMRRDHPSLGITVTMRVIGRDLADAEQYVADAASAGADGVLVVMGDPPKGVQTGPALAPSRVAASLRGRDVSVFLSLLAEPDFDRIGAKLEAAPEGFFTQVVGSIQQVSRICGRLRPSFRIIPCVMVPSAKNMRSAKMLHLDWSGYEGDPAGFIGEVHDAAGDVLVSSPNDFAAALDAMKGAKL